MKVEPMAAELPLGTRLESLAKLLGSVRGAAVEVVVSDRFARYFPFQRLPGVRTVEELGTTVMAVFEERFGQQFADWELRFDIGPLSPRGFACALPRPLVEGVRELVAGLGGKRVSITTFYCASINAYADAIPAVAWVAAHADRQTTLGRCEDGVWHSVRALEGDDPVALDELIERERLRGVYPDGDTPAYAMGVWPQAGQGVQRLGADHWPGQGASFSSDYRVALAGVWN
jgi:hypothetical protein